MDTKELFTYEEAMEYLGIKRSTLQAMMNDLDVPTQKFRYDRKRYITRFHVERMKHRREKPWEVNLPGDDQPAQEAERIRQRQKQGKPEKSVA